MLEIVNIGNEYLEIVDIGKECLNLAMFLYFFYVFCVTTFNHLYRGPCKYPSDPLRPLSIYFLLYFILLHVIINDLMEIKQIKSNHNHCL